MPKWAIIVVVIASILAALFVAAAIGLWVDAGATFPPSAVVVGGLNMMPTMLPGDRILLDAHGQNGPGSIVVFEAPGHEGISLISRVVATGGQTVDLGKDGAVYVDGKRLSEPYVHGARTDPLGSTIAYPVKVPDRSVWIMGDNRSNSGDSREYGPVPVSSIRGVAAVRWWPLTRFTRFHDGR
jgi:signal peptidase I